jgi:hypothetical protein
MKLLDEDASRLELHTAFTFSGSAIALPKMMAYAQRLLVKEPKRDQVAFCVTFSHGISPFDDSRACIFLRDDYQMARTPFFNRSSLR